LTFYFLSKKYNYLLLLNTDIAGNSIPSNHSRKAPPADEIYVNVSLTPALFKAEDVSPPPATVIKLLLVVKFDA